MSGESFAVLSEKRLHAVNLQNVTTRAIRDFLPCHPIQKKNCGARIHPDPNAAVSPEEVVYREATVFFCEATAANMARVAS